MSARCVASQPRDLATMWVGSGMIRALRLPSGDGVLPLVLGHPIRDHGLGFTVGHITIELDRDKQTATKIMVGNPRPNGTLDCRSEEHTSELQSLMRISYAVFCLKKKQQPTRIIYNNNRQS